MMRFAQFALVALLLTACGFQPLQGKAFRDASSINLAAVEVQTNTSHFGQLLKSEIEDQVNPDYRHTPKLYRITINVSENEISLFINPDGTSSRGDLQFTTTYKFTRIADSKLITSGMIQRISSYNNSQNADYAYASYVSRQDARKRATLELGQDYKMRLANIVSTLNNPDARLPNPTEEEPEVAPIIHSQYENETRNSGH